MARHRSCSIAFKRQVVQGFLGGEALYGLARRHDVSRNLIRVWVAKYEAGAFDITDVAVASGFVYIALILDAWSRRVVSSATLVPAYFDRQLNTSRG